MKNNLFQLWLVLLLVAYSTHASADDYAGRFFRASGRWTGTKLKADQITWRTPEKNRDDGGVRGRVEWIDMRSRYLMIGPVAVQWTDDTRFKDLKLGDIKAGRVVRVNGRFIGAKQLRAASISIDRKFTVAPVFEITGRASASHVHSDSAVQVEIAGVPIRTLTHGFNLLKLLTIRQNARRPEVPFSVPVFNRPLALTGQYSFSTDYRDNFSLDGSSKEDVILPEQVLQLEAFYRWNDRAAFFIRTNINYEAQFPLNNRPSDAQAFMQRDEAWAYFGRIWGSPISLQLGRQNIAEPRQWWWDEDLDSLRLYLDYGPWHAQLAGGEELGQTSTQDDRIDEDEEGIRRGLGLVSYLWAPKEYVEGFFMHQWDTSSTQREGSLVAANRKDDEDRDLTWFGLRVRGDRSLETPLKNYGALLYWFDAGGVFGHVNRLSFDDVNDRLSRVSGVTPQDIGGWAIDTGLSWTAPIDVEPTFTLNYARASEDFQQTGLQGNSWRYRGVTNFKIYGELLEPELANLEVATAGLGFPLLNNSSIDFVYHHYRQITPREILRDTRLERDPNGISGDIGQGWDVVLNFRDSRRLEIGLIGSLFRAGDAFGERSGNLSSRVQLEFTLNF